MLRTFELRLKPNAAQRAEFEHILADSCETYNAALQERRDAWKTCQKAVGLYEQFAELAKLRKDPEFATIASNIQREPLRRVNRAFQAFFRRLKAGQKPGYPRFRSRDRYNSFAWHEPSLTTDGLLIPRFGRIRFRASRILKGKFKTATVIRCNGKWAARICCDIGPAPEKRTVATVVGVDVGLTTLATLSDGTEIENPHWAKQHEDRILAAHRLLSRKQKRSKNHTRAREALHRAVRRSTNARKNYLHHVSKWLVTHYDLIAHEALNVQDMASGNRAKFILDAAWSMLLSQIHYKAESAGVYAIAVNPRGTTQNCSGCGDKVPKGLSDRWHDCPKCGLSIGRDHNAGRNILALGISAAGLSPSQCVASYISPIPISVV